MNNKKSIPEIRVIFSLIKNDDLDFDREAVTEQLKITPTESRGPKLSKGRMVCPKTEDDLTLAGITVLKVSPPPYCYILHACWNIELPKISSWNVEDPLQRLEKILEDRQLLVRNVCKQYDLYADLVIRVFADSNNMPEVTLSSKSLLFWASMGVNIDFDFYLD